MKPSSLYKYKSLAGENFKFTQDIFINKRIYLPSAKQFNDPNEGIGVISINNGYKEWGNVIEEENRKSTRIYSLSEQNRNGLMWSHYANNQSGICIQFNFSKFIQNKFRVLRKVKYVNQPISVAHFSLNNYFKFFEFKQACWKYEKEWRIIANKETEYLSLDKSNIEAIFLGPRIEKENIEWVKFWAAQFNPNFKIPIIEMTYASQLYDLVTIHEIGSHSKRQSI